MRADSSELEMKYTKRFYYLVGALVLIGLIVAIVASFSAGDDSITDFTEGETATPEELESIRANESGSIIIVRYKSIGESDQAGRSVEGLRSDLEWLYENGYRSISLQDLSEGSMRVSSGMTPVLITFDGFDESHLRFKNGAGSELDLDCAAGVLQEFVLEKPDFGLNAVFFIGEDFRGDDKEAGESIKALVKAGFSTGVYVQRDEESIKNAEDLEKAISEVEDIVQKQLKGFRAQAVSLEHGLSEEILKTLTDAESEEEERLIFNSDSRPCPSPHNSSFNKASIPRISGFDFQDDGSNVSLIYWMDYFRKNPERKYISDGNPLVVTVPAHMRFRIDENLFEEDRVRLY